MKRAEVRFHNRLAGILSENDSGYVFAYLADYLNTENPEPVSLTLPLGSSSYHSRVLFPFFDGLIPEGWLLEIAHKTWKLDRRDRMSLLLATCRDCIGAVSIIPVELETSDE